SCLASKSDCALVDNFVGKVNEALNSLEKGSADHSRLSAVSDKIGSKDDGNGFTIGVANLRPNVAGQPDGLNGMTLDLKKIARNLAPKIRRANKDMTQSESQSVAGASTLV